MKIVCIGDSITTGQLLDPHEAPWPALLHGVTAIAKGNPGDTSRLILERFPRDVQQLAPDVVIIQCGHNDANRWQTDRGLPRVSLAAFSANLEEMIDRVETFGAVPVLCTLTPSHRNETHAADCRLYDTALREVAWRRQIRLADVRSAFRGAENLLMDGLHLTAEGHRVYAEIVARVLP